MSNLSSAASWNHPVFAPPPLYPTAAPLEPYPSTLPPVYTRVSAGNPDGRASVHAVLDYDYDDYYDDEDFPKGPVATKNNGTLPVVPLYSFQTLTNGTIVQVPIVWTALSLALGLEIRGDVIRGTPCIKKHHQLFCPTKGNTYPLDKIENFIDENKALIKRMYGEFQNSNEYGPPGREPVVTEPPPTPPPRDYGHHGGHHGHHGPNRGKATSYVSVSGRARRQAFNDTNTSSTGRVDACLSKVEIVTPYWAANSAGKVRAIVNTENFEQAIHQEVCSKGDTPRCRNDCGCEQKYKWHRLLAYDPDNDCKGIFMDWFLFPSCCVCRCKPFNN